jgi:hypothetical protein
MTITAKNLFQAAGVSAAAAGAIFVAVQINHPHADMNSLVTTEMAVRETAKAVMSVLALVGIAGMFVRNHRRFGVVGLVGYVLLTIGYLAMFVTECVVGFVLPAVARTSPAYVQGFIDEAMGRTSDGGIGRMHYVLLAMAMGYAVGGLLFGIALFRAGILARWASVLLAYGTVSVLGLAFLPESFSRPFAIPTGVALIGLGVSLWRDQRTASAPGAQPASREHLAVR